MLIVLLVAPPMSHPMKFLPGFKFFYRFERASDVQTNIMVATEFQHTKINFPNQIINRNDFSISQKYFTST